MDEQIKQPSAQNQVQNVPDYTNEINAMYDAQRQQQVQSLENAYNQNVQTLQDAKQSIAPTFNTQANDLATQYERTRRNNNLQADYNGLNTGTASQMALAQQSNYLNAFGNIRAKQAQAEQDVENQLAQLEISYKNAVSQAIADNDFQRASALMNEYKRRDEAAKEEQRYQYQISLSEQKYQDQLRRQAEEDAFAREQYNNQLARQQEQDAFNKQQYEDSMALNKAKTLASYGDFSGYSELYGPEVANAMQQYWNIYNGGSSGSSGSSGGTGYRGSGSGNGNNGPNGPGNLNLDNPPDGGKEIVDAGEGNGALSDKEFNTMYYKYLDQYGNVADATSAMARDFERTSFAQAQREALQMGLREGSAGFNAAVSERYNALLSQNEDYASAKSMHNFAAEEQKARQLAEQEQARHEQLWGNYDPNSIDMSDAIAWAEINDREAEYRRLTEQSRAQAEAILATQKAQRDGRNRSRS